MLAWNLLGFRLVRGHPELLHGNVVLQQEALGLVLEEVQVAHGGRRGCHRSRGGEQGLPEEEEGDAFRNFTFTSVGMGTRPRVAVQRKCFSGSLQPRAGSRRRVRIAAK
jgi:hypothetical protein